MSSYVLLFTCVEEDTRYAFEEVSKRLDRYERRLGTVEQERDEMREKYEGAVSSMQKERGEMKTEMTLMREAFDGLRTAVIGGVCAVVVTGIASAALGLGIHP